MKKELPKYIIEFLDNNKYDLIDILQFNQRKYVYVLKVKKDDKYYILKTFDNDLTPREIQNKLKIEQEFYKRFKSGIFPKLILVNENIIILEYVESISLRELLIKNESKINLLQNLFNSFELFQVFLKNDNKICKNNNFDNIYRYITSLSNSHPIQVKDLYVDKIDIVLNRIVTKLLNMQTNKILNNIDNKNLIKCFSHMDFHYNNILVDSNLNIRFIDFENIRYNGYFEFDILFLIVLIEVYIYDRSYEFELLQIYRKKLFQKNKILEEIYKIYKIAISVNKKFYIDSKKKSLNKFQKIGLIIKLLAKV